MGEASEQLHEDREDLSQKTVDLHRALVSLQEELEAADWYQQRVDATDDEELGKILAHNRDEEKEHAVMVLEWIRRRDPTMDEMLRTYLFTEGDVTQTEKDPPPAENEDPDDDGSLRIGSLKESAKNE